jgi:hypothetical protein
MAAPVDRRLIPHRLSQRRSASITTADGAFVTDCVVLDYSISGARLSVGSPSDVPDDFLIAFTSGIRWPCQLAWRGASEIGAHFKRFVK